MAIVTTKARAAAALDEILDGITNVGFATGDVRLYTGTIPANITVGATGTLLATCVIGGIASPAFSATDTATLIATGNTLDGFFAADTNPVAGGTIGYWRLRDSGGIEVLQGTVGTSGTVDITFNTLTVVAGILVVINTMTIQINGVF